MVWDFFANLGRQRMNAAQAKVKGKISGAGARAKSKAAAKVNKGLDNAGKKAANKAKGVVPKKGKKASGDKPQRAEQPRAEQPKKVSGGNRGGGGEPMSHDDDASFGDKTQFIQVVEEGPKECVGWIVVLNGGLKGQDFRLVPGKNVIGTAADCDVVLTDQYLSGRHAVIRYEEGRFTLVDLDSTNGTFVNDERISKEELIDNDRLRLARSEVKFKALY